MSNPIFIYLIILLSITAHEYSHAFVANELGDETAKKLGRLTLNPISHIDLIGTVFMPLLSMSIGGGFIGWAKPVPYNPNLLKDKKYGEVKIAIAGPLSNLIMAFMVAIFLALAPAHMISNPQYIQAILQINVSLAVFNLIPVPPLDGSKLLYLLLPKSAREQFESFGMMGIFVALIMASFAVPLFSNLIIQGMALTIYRIQSIFY